MGKKKHIYDLYFEDINHDDVDDTYENHDNDNVIDITLGGSVIMMIVLILSIMIMMKRVIVMNHNENDN